MLITLSAQHMREEIERKAYAYGVSPVIAFLLGEHAVAVLREARAEQAVFPPRTTTATAHA